MRYYGQWSDPEKPWRCVAEVRNGHWLTRQCNRARQKGKELCRQHEILRESGKYVHIPPDELQPLS